MEKEKEITITFTESEYKVLMKMFNTGLNTLGIEAKKRLLVWRETTIEKERLLYDANRLLEKLKR